MKLVATVTAPTMAALRARRDAVRAADLVELRLDTVADPDVAGALQGRRMPVLITCRPTWEGGSFAGPEEVRRRLLAQAIDQGAEYVDVEWRAGFDELIGRSGGRRLVISHHDFAGIPADLEDRLRAMRATGAEVVKLAVQVPSLAGCVRLLEAGQQFGGERQPLVLLGMGRQGFATRALAAHFGSCWTYAGSEAAVGQVAPGQMLDEYRFHEVTASTAIYGLVGAPLGHSVSPAMHNAAFRAAGLDAVYVPFEARDADDFLTLAAALGVQGASVTIPFKRDLLERVAADERSRTAGAVNTLRRDGGGWAGTNTDIDGFLAPLAGRSLAGQRVAVLGAGGAARAVALALAGTGARVTVRARNPVQAMNVARLAGGTSGPLPPAPGTWDVLVNATPVGMYPHVHESPVPAGALDGALVYDLVYNPPVTRLLEEAAAAGCATIGGLDMLIAQACAQFRWWTGREADRTVMKEAAIGRLGVYAAADRA